MGSRAGLDGRKNLVRTGIRSRTVQSRSQSLYGLSYPYALATLLNSFYSDTSANE